MAGREKKKGHTPHIAYYGNYLNYYKKRTSDDAFVDDRFRYFKPEWFVDKRVLDIGCNSGLVTLVVGALGAELAMGIDIDEKLIGRAIHNKSQAKTFQKRLKELALKMMEEGPILEGEEGGKEREKGEKGEKGEKEEKEDKEDKGEKGKEGEKKETEDPQDPTSKKRKRSSSPTPSSSPSSPSPSDDSPQFLSNVRFRTENIITHSAPPKHHQYLIPQPQHNHDQNQNQDQDEDHDQQRPNYYHLSTCLEVEYDTILCLSVTKWVHLNWGDQGMLKLFSSIYSILRKGGRLIIEPQPFKSYAKKKKLSPAILENYKSIELKPRDFPAYLVAVVGFKRVSLLHESMSVNGFDRQIYECVK